MCFVKLGSQKLSKWCWNILCSGSPHSRALEVTCPQLAKKRTSAPQLKFRTAWCSDNNISKQIKPLTCSDPLPAQRLSHARATDPYLLIRFNELDNFIVNFPPEQFFCFSSIIHWVQEHQLHTQLSQPERDSKEFVFSHSSFKYSCHYMSKTEKIWINYDGWARLSGDGTACAAPTQKHLEKPTPNQLPRLSWPSAAS